MDPRRPLSEVDEASSQPILLSHFGALIENPADFSNPSVQCICNPVDRLPSGAIAVVDKPFLLNAGIAALGALEPGRIYAGGVMAKEVPSKRRRLHIQISVPASDCGAGPLEKWYKTELCDVSDGKGQSATSSAFAAIKILPARAMPFERNRHRLTASDGEDITVVFNELEIIRYYYTNSNRLVRALFAGDFQAHRLYDKVLDDSISKAFHDIETDVHWFQYRAGFSRHDAPLIGRILFDRHAMAGADRVQRSLARSGMRSKLEHARTIFPFVGSAHLTVLGRWFKNPEGRYFRVDRIETCTAPFPFRTLRVMETSASASAKSSDDSTEVEKPSIVKTGSLLPNAPMNSLTLAAANSPPSESIPGLRHLSGAFEIEFEKPPPELRNRAKRIFVRGNEWIQTSPGGTTSGDTDSSVQKLSDDLVNGTIPKGLESFREVLERLAPLIGHSSQEDLPTLAVGREVWKDPESGIIYCAFPVRLEQRGTVNAFSFTTSSCEVRRYFVVAEVKTRRNDYMYVLDSEPRKKKGGSADLLGVRLLAAKNWQPIPIALFERFIEDTVHSKRWGLNTPGLFYKSIKHKGGSVVTETHARLAEAIMEPRFWREV